MFVACGIWCLADVSSVSPSSEQTAVIHNTVQQVYMYCKTLLTTEKKSTKSHLFS